MQQTVQKILEVTRKAWGLESAVSADARAALASLLYFKKT